MASIQLAIYKTPSQASSIGTTKVEEVTLTSGEIRAIRDYYDATANAQNLFYGAFVSACVGALTRNCKLAFNLTSSAASGIITSVVFESYFSQLATKFDLIINANTTTFKATYTYKRKGSNDGAYWLTDIKAQ